MLNICLEPGIPLDAWKILVDRTNARHKRKMFSDTGLYAQQTLTLPTEAQWRFCEVNVASSQWFRALVALAVDLGPVPSTHTASITPVPGDLILFSDLLGTRLT